MRPHAAEHDKDNALGFLLSYRFHGRSITLQAANLELIDTLDQITAAQSAELCPTGAFKSIDDDAAYGIVPPVLVAIEKGGLPDDQLEITVAIAPRFGARDARPLERNGNVDFHAVPKNGQLRFFLDVKSSHVTMKHPRILHASRLQSLTVEFELLPDRCNDRFERFITLQLCCAFAVCLLPIDLSPQRCLLKYRVHIGPEGLFGCRPLSRGFKGLRIGVPVDYFYDDIDPEIEAAVRAGITLMEREGASIREISMPWVSEGRKINLGVNRPESVSVHEEWMVKYRDQYSIEVLARLESAATIPAVEYIRAQRARRWFNEKMAQATRDVDVLVTPTVPIQTPGIEACIVRPDGDTISPATNLLGIFTGVFDTTGEPSLSLNCGFTKDGMPIGMMISGKPFDEVSVLRAGAAFEAAAGLSDRRPPIA